MATLTAAVIILLVFGGAAVAVSFVFAARIKQASDVATPVISSGREGAIASAPPRLFTRRNYFFSAAERSFYEILRRLDPEYTVFAKVRLSDLVRVQAAGREFWEKFNSINGKHVDFVLCDETLAPVVAIELDDASHDGADRIKRDGFVDSVFQSAALPIVHVRAKRGYVLEEIRQLLAPHLPARSAGIVHPPEAKYLPRKGWRPSA